MAVLLSIFALLLTLSDLYILFFVLGSVSWLAKGWLLIPALIFWALVIRICFSGDTNQWILNSVIWIVVCVMLPTILFTLFSLLGKCLGLIWQPFLPVFSWLGLGLSAIWFVIALYGSIFGWRRLEVHNTEVSIAGLPENFKGYRIAQLTDFHISVYSATPGAVDKIVEKVNSLKPDLIVFTGDLVNSSPEEATPFIEALGRLKARDGVISVLGNHDYCIYHHYSGGDTPERALGRLVDAEEKMGWNLLRNQSVQIVRGNDSIAIVGVENAGSGQFPDKSDLKKALQNIPENECKILLSHDPSHWRREVLPATNIPLMLAGHTHAMQFKIGNFSPSQWIYPEWGGLYQEADRKLFVSTGIGGNIAFRFGVYPTIDIITLR